MKKIGIVGLGLNNPYFYAPLLEKNGAKVACVWDNIPERAEEYARQFDCEVIKSIELFPQLDGVMIEGKNCDHLSLARHFMKENIPVFIEKPLSNCEEEAIAFCKEAENALVFSCSPLRWAPSYLQMAEDIWKTQEKIVRCSVTVYHTMKHFVENPAKQWHDDPRQSGGMITDIGIHAVELLHMFIKRKPAKILAVSTKCHFHNAHCNDNYAVTVQYPDGAIGSLALLCATEKIDYAVEVITPSHAFINRAEQEYTGNPLWNVENAYGGFEGTLRAFLQMIETGVKPLSMTETERNFEFLHAVKQVMNKRK